MSSVHSKSAFLHGQIRRALQSGTSPAGTADRSGYRRRRVQDHSTPVRLALCRLVGGGLDCGSGTQRLQPTEVAMRDMTGWVIPPQIS